MDSESHNERAKVIFPGLRQSGRLTAQIAILKRAIANGKSVKVLVPNENVKAIRKYFIWDKEQWVINFGKHAGITLQNMVMFEYDYLLWMLKQDFPEAVLDIVSEVIEEEVGVRLDYLEGE